MKATYHLARVIETWNGDSSTLSSQQISPELDSEAALYQYVTKVLPSPSLRTDVEVVYQYGKRNAYGLREMETEELHDWMKRQEYQR